MSAHSLAAAADAERKRRGNDRATAPPEVLVGEGYSAILDREAARVYLVYR